MPAAAAAGPGAVGGRPFSAPMPPLMPAAEIVCGNSCGCKEGEVCKDGKCVPKPECEKGERGTRQRAAAPATPAPQPWHTCPAALVLTAGFAPPADKDCKEGEVCKDGKCVPKPECEKGERGTRQRAAAPATPAPQPWHTCPAALVLTAGLRARRL